jgi:hypothetical protein
MLLFYYIEYALRLFVLGIESLIGCCKSGTKGSLPRLAKAKPGRDWGSHKRLAHSRQHFDQRRNHQRITRTRYSERIGAVDLPGSLLRGWLASRTGAKKS